MNQSSVESWRPVVGYEGIYSVSDAGRVRREIRASWGHGNTHPGKLLSLYPMGPRGSKTYPQVKLLLNGKQTSTLVHRIVAAAFIGPCPNRHNVNHKNGVKTDNRIENLEYVTYSENARHAHRTGLRHAAPSHGSANGMSKLTENQARDIWVRFQAGQESQEAIAKSHGVTQTCVSRIACGQTWRHITALASGN